MISAAERGDLTQRAQLACNYVPVERLSQDSCFIELIG